MVTTLPAPTQPLAASVPRTRLFALAEMRWATTSLVLFLLGLAGQLAHGPELLYWILYLSCYGAGGWGPGLTGLRALRHKTLDVDLLMVVAAIGAAAIGQITDGALLIVIFATSGALEALATARTEDSVRGLLDLAPDTATRLGADGAQQLVRVVDLDVGDIVLIRPGERIAADGTVVAGASEINQATITGEALPINKTTDDEVFAGTVNGTGTLRIQVDQRAENSMVARIAAMVQQATQTKARTQLFIERVEQRYSIGMVATTIAVFVVPLLYGDTLSRAVLRAMTFMIVASPCAVVLATMPPLLAAIANAGRHGVLAKSAVVMESLGATTQLAFDKTGTLTQGTPELAAIHMLPNAPSACTISPVSPSSVCTLSPVSEDQLLRLAAAAELPSEHPLAAAIVRAARARGLQLPDTTQFVAEPGRGVTATVQGRVVGVGSPNGLRAAASQADIVRVRPLVDAVQAAGHTAVIVTSDGHPIAVLAITDQVRREAAATVAAATRLTGHAPVLLTGDNLATAQQLAAAVGIADVHADLLPHEKVAAVASLQAAGQKVTVVGDGINDAPALAAAYAGIAMGAAGSDLTMQAADAVVVRDDVSAIPTVIALSRRARRVVVANLAIASTFISCLVIWDLVGTLPLPLGVAGHEGSTVIVGLNGLRLLRAAAWQRAARSVFSPPASQGPAQCSRHH